MKKRAYEIEVRRAPAGEFVGEQMRSYTVIANGPEKAMGKAINAARKDTGYHSPWRVTRLTEIGETI